MASFLLSPSPFTLIESWQQCLCSNIFASLLLYIYLPTWNAFSFLLRFYNPFISSEKINHTKLILFTVYILFSFLYELVIFFSIFPIKVYVGADTGLPTLYGVESLDS